MQLFTGTVNKLDYIYNKLKNMVDDFYLENIRNPRFTSIEHDVDALDTDLIILERIIANQYAYNPMEKALVAKYVTIADEFRATK